MDSIVPNKSMYLLDGSFMSGIKPYVNINNIMKHPLWGSNLLLEDEEAIIKCHKDYIKGNNCWVPTTYV